MTRVFIVALMVTAIGLSLAMAIAYLFTATSNFG